MFTPIHTHEFADLASAAPNCVVLGDAGNALNYPNLNRAFQLCQQGAPLVGIGMNRYFMGEQGLMLDAVGGFFGNLFGGNRQQQAPRPRETTSAAPANNAMASLFANAKQLKKK